ncbi:Ig-like domain-containing protein [Plantactinospora soyae]|uniref:VCBS repeat-containing protein n=1 Tax=Plantactinospora soyae TaxID=1544732 RepID=A0A927QVS8_9ACTN|nr:Ig-like domain-containing protein [Plantactinospora soyae]MBE1484742.1 hypothetical protein [Plantactinospora soyae]
MWNKRCAAAVVLITMASVGAVAPGAQAGYRGDSLYGDYNADGFLDTAVLGVVEPNLCSTIVTFGAAPGVFVPPIAYTYPKPGGGTVFTDCPDIGVAINLDADPNDELWVGWTPGPPPPATFSQVVLQPPTFTPAATYISQIVQPSFIDKGRFSAGGRYSPYLVGTGGVQNFTTLDGVTWRPGPIDYCSEDAPTVQLADWTRNGTDGTLVAYTRGCDDNSNGVVRIREDGSIQQLEIDLTGRTTWTARVVNANADRFPDVRTTNQLTGAVSTFINDATNAPGLLIRAPKANTDSVQLAVSRAIAIDVLANDFATRDARVVVTVQPRYGTTQVLSDRRVVYRPNPTHGRTDRFTYQLVDEGRRSSANVTIRFPA